MKSPRKNAIPIMLSVFLIVISLNFQAVEAQGFELTVTGTASNSVTLAWTSYTGIGLNFYRINRRLSSCITGESCWQFVGDVSPSVKTYSVGGLTSGTDYNFRVLAMKGTLGSPSAQILQIANPIVSATPGQSFQGIALTAGTPTTTTIPLTWTPSTSARTTHYWVYKKLSTSATWVGAYSITDRTDTSEVVQFLTPATPYDFKIEARDGANSSSVLLRISNIATKTTQPTGMQDTTPPTVSVSHSPASPQVNQLVSISASATDNVQMSRIDIFVDNIKQTNTVCSQQSAQQMTCTRTNTYTTVGTHTYFAQAVDGNNNIARDPTTGTKSFTVGIGVISVKPTANIISISPNPANLSQPVTFRGNGTPPLGRFITGYEWNSSINGFINSLSTFTRSTLSEGTHTISFRVRDSASAWSDPAIATLVIGAAPPPSQLTASINSITPSAPSFGQEVTFSGSGTAAFGGIIASYEWSSNIDGVLGTGQTFSTRDLSVGSHTITFKVTDDLGAEASATKALTVKTQSLGNPVQVVPRFVTLGNVVRAYNVTPGYPNVFCKITYGDQDAPCGTFVKSQFAEVCPRGRLNSPVLEFDLVENKSHLFTIAQSASSAIPIEPVVGAGDLEVQLLSPSGSGDPQDFGTLVDEDFLPSGLKLEVGTPVNVEKVKVGANYVNGVFYSLYKVSNCGMKEITPLTPMDYFGRQKNFFVSFIQPSDCGLGETCNYVGEIIALNGNQRGGLLYGFSYSRPLELLGAAPTSYDFGNITTPYTATIPVTVENTGADFIENLSAATSSPRLALALDKSTLEAGETTELSITLSVPETATAGSYRDEVNITSVSETGDIDKKVVPITYNVVEVIEETPPPPEEEIPPPPEAIGATVSPGTWEIGKIAQNKVAELNFAFGVSTADTADVKAEVKIPSDFADIFVSDKVIVDIGKQETRAKVTFTATKDVGTYSTELSFAFTKPGADTETIDVPVTFEIIEDVQGLLDAANSEYNQLNSKFENLDSILENNNKLASKVQDDRTKARESLEDAKTSLGQAKSALDSNNKERAKERISDANDKLADARRAINNINSVVDAISETPKRNLLPVFIIVSVAAVVGFFIFAIREGWIPLYKFPWLKDIFEKIGLGSLIEKPVDLAPKPRFTPQALGVARPQPVVQRPPGAPAQPVRPVTPPMTPEQKAKMEAYARQHPEYAAYLKQKQSSYDNRRYE